MIKLKQAVIVEGKYDKIKLQSIIDAVIITTDGFGIYNDREKTELIRMFARKDGIIILTDSDHAGLQIRNRIKNIVGGGKVFNVYIPDIMGKEKRKQKPSAENKLGVEGMSADILTAAFKKAGVFSVKTEESETRCEFTRVMLYDDGIMGNDNSAELRRNLLSALGLPENLSVTALLEVLNAAFTADEYRAALKQIYKNDKDLK